MKLPSKGFILVISLMLGFSVSSNAQGKKKAENDTNNWRYEINCINVGVKGTYIIKVWSYSKKPKIAIEQAKKNAVHGIVFRGFTGNGSNCNSQSALANNSNLANEQKDFFKEFFTDGGKYMQFVNLSNDGSIDSGDITKVSKKEFKVGVIVSVNKDALRKDLEDAGIIKGLSTGF